MTKPSRSSRPNRLELGPRVWIDRGDITIVASRGSGPGGQSVNKVSTAITLRLPITAIHGLSEPARDRLRVLAGGRLTRDDELVLRARAQRSQLDNRRACELRLRALVADALVEPKVRKKVKPTRRMIERRLETKRQRSRTKRDRGWRSSDGG